MRMDKLISNVYLSEIVVEMELLHDSRRKMSRYGDTGGWGKINVSY